MRMNSVALQTSQSQSNEPPLLHFLSSTILMTVLVTSIGLIFLLTASAYKK